MSSYLPQDGSKYEVCCSMWFTGESTDGCAAQINISTDYISANTAMAYNVTRADAPYYCAGNAILLFGSGKQLKVSRSNFGSGTCKYTLMLIAYRKVR